MGQQADHKSLFYQDDDDDYEEEECSWLALLDWTMDMANKLARLLLLRTR